MGLGVPGRELNSLVEARLQPAADPLRQRLDDGNLLGVAPERQRVEIEGVGEIGRGRLERFGPLDGGEEDLASPLAFRLEIGRIDVGGLVGGVGADRPERRALVDRRAEVAAVIGPPGRLQRLDGRLRVEFAVEARMAGERVLDEGRVGERLAVAAMQLRPRRLELRALVGVGLRVVGKRVPP
jgi:hypothetical protein